MQPILFIHGYSAESKKTTNGAIAGIYGTLPGDLRKLYPGQVFEVDLSRYISLEDGVTIDDLSRALDRALNEDFAPLLTGNDKFNVIIHSTGALVIRNWIRRFSRKPSPVANLIYLAGANLGSGWAHIGKGQLAKWARKVFQGGTERGVQVLDALELGSRWTLDLHLSFLKTGSTMAADYRIREFVVIGTQADVKWYEIPIRYAKEDGSDGVVRVSASNLNFQYFRFGPTDEARALPWREVKKCLDKHMGRTGRRGEFYEIKERSLPGENGRPVVPFAILHECAHSGEEMGIVMGDKPRRQVLDVVKKALDTTPAQWPARVADFEAVTNAAYDKVAESARNKSWNAWLLKWIDNPARQYDHHAQVIFRVRDQDGRPVEHFDVFFDSVRGPGDRSDPIGALFEDKHLNEKSPNVILFYLRTDTYDADTEKWVSRVRPVQGCFLEVSAVEPETGEIAYLPMRFEFETEQLVKWIVGHRTTIIDVELLRLPSPEVFRIVRT